MITQEKINFMRGMVKQMTSRKESYMANLIIQQTLKMKKKRIGRMNSAEINLKPKPLNITE